MNILILSAGTRNAIVTYFRQALGGGGRVVAADADPLSPALYEADRYYVIPPICAPDYIDRVMGICERERITGVMSLIDPETCRLARDGERFRAAGVTLIGSNAALCELAYDKYRMYQWMRAHGYPCAASWPDRNGFLTAVAAGEAGYPVFMKPVRSSASVNACIAPDPATVEWVLAHKSGMMLQRYLPGAEIGADVYVDLISGETVSVFTKKKLRMRAGETDRSVSIKDDRLFDLIGRFVTEAGFLGPVDIDLFETEEGYVISDVNPRFGGGYPHAHACGCDHVRMIVENLRGKSNRKRIGQYPAGVYMIKYSEATVLDRLPEAAGMEALLTREGTENVEPAKSI